MAHITENRIVEQSTTAGTGALALTAVTGYRRFGVKMAINDTCHYLIEAVDSVGRPTGEYEFGIGTYSAANTLSRTTVAGSSNSDNLVNFGSGTKRVVMVVLAPTSAAIRSHWVSAIGAEPAIAATATDKYFRGDKSWRDFFTDVRAATLTGLSTVANAAVVATDTVLVAFGKLQKQISDHLARIDNPHATTKAQVGLGNVENTSDANKPISIATQNALNAKASLSGASFTGGVSTPITFSAPASTNWAFQTTSYSTAGLYRVLNVLDASSGGIDCRFTVWHQVGVFALARITVNQQEFNMNDAGVGSSAGGWSATSDRRVKYDLQRIGSALDKLEQLTGYTYLRPDMADKSGNVPRRAGLLAQDVLKVLRETVNVPSNYDAERNEGDLLTLSLDGLVALLVNGVNELRAEFAAYRATHP